MITATINVIWPKQEVEQVIVALLHLHTTKLVPHIQLVKAVHLAAFAMLVPVVDSVLTNFLMEHLAAAACNVNLKCAHNMIINKTFAIHASVITLRRPTLMAWRELHIVTPIINIAQTISLARIKRQLAHRVTEIILCAILVSVIKIP